MFLINAFLSRLLYSLMFLLRLTLRFRYDDHPESKELKKEGKAYLLAIWHQVLIPGILVQKGRPFVVMVSRSKDADAVAYLAKKFNYIVLRGSSSKKGKDKGGKAALSEMIKVVKSGYPGSITVDGPTGPAKKAKKGIIVLSQESDAPIIPYHAAIESYWQFNSWDKFKLPKPFSRVIISYGAPLKVNGLSLEEGMSLLTTKINNAEASAESLFYSWDELATSDFF